MESRAFFDALYFPALYSDTARPTMQHTSHASKMVRCGVFEIDLKAFELRKHGLRLKLAEQPFQILAILLEQPGEVITRDELRERLWPGDTFVDFDHGLNNAVMRLREVLGDSPENPRFIETLPRRGYRFIAPMSSSNGNEAHAGAGPITPTRRWRMPLLVVALLAALVAGGLIWRGRQGHLTEKDTIILADFANSTGDPVFDGTLREGLSVELEQSPFLSLISEAEIHETLRMMER